jgi:hypothetical protein
MKTCPNRMTLESAALGELHEGRVSEIESHAEGCARCRHELNWLRAETAMFAQRAAREEVSRLWEGVAEVAAPRRSMKAARAVLAVAASLLLAIALGGKISGASRGSQRSQNDSSVPMSLEMMSVEQQRASMPCYTPGFGIACGEVEYASR